jgi:hypothetical protein
VVADPDPAPGKPYTGKVNNAGAVLMLIPGLAADGVKGGRVLIPANTLNRGDVAFTGPGYIKIDGSASSRTMTSCSRNGAVSTGCAGNYTARKNDNLARF